MGKISVNAIARLAVVLGRPVVIASRVVGKNGLPGTPSPQPVSKFLPNRPSDTTGPVGSIAGLRLTDQAPKHTAFADAVGVWQTRQLACNYLQAQAVHDQERARTNREVFEPEDQARHLLNPAHGAAGTLSSVAVYARVIFSVLGS